MVIWRPMSRMVRLRYVFSLRTTLVRPRKLLGVRLGLVSDQRAFGDKVRTIEGVASQPEASGDDDGRAGSPKRGDITSDQQR